MILREYQTRAIENIIDCAAINPILAAPTGSGKTVMGAEIVKRLACKTLWIAHRIELIEQAARALGGDVGYIKAGYEPNSAARVQVASVQTLARRELPQVDVVIWDECHHCNSADALAIIQHYNTIPIIGLTATPFRLDGRGLGDAGFRRIVVAARMAELVEQGYLHAPRVFALKLPDLRGIRKQAGDYAVSQLSGMMQQVPLIEAIVESWIDKANDGRTVCFAVDVAHSRMIAAAFGARGIACEHIDGTTPPIQRADILARLKSGETKIVCNCALLTEGYDLPALECAILARPTASLNLHLQQIGRIVRAAEEKAGALVLDHAGNHNVHGSVMRHIEYSLESTKRAGESESLGLRRCGGCYLMYAIGLRACPECGWVPDYTARKLKMTTGELEEYREDFGYRAAVYQSLLQQAENAGYKRGWAAYRFNDLFGSMPQAAGGELVDPLETDRRADVYRALLEDAKRDGRKPGFAYFRFKDIYGVGPINSAKIRAEVFG